MRLKTREIDTVALLSFHAPVVKLALALLCLAVVGCASNVPPRAHQVVSPRPLPVALNPDFAFRKTIQYFLDPMAKPLTGQVDAAVYFESSYRMFGAVTALDRHERFGNYYAFFWRARRPADVTVRLEYRQDKLHAFTQAREFSYRHAHGTNSTVFAIIGDDFFDHGRVIAWRASLIVDGRIVATNRSYLWE